MVIGDYTNKNKALFKSHKTKNGIIPPDGGLMSWTTVSRTRRGVSENGPAPKCRVRNNTANNVELITIEGCGVPEVNGVYMRNGDQSDKVPEYMKRGTWKGSPGIFDIQRGEEYGSSWQIGFWRMRIVKILSRLLPPFTRYPPAKIMLGCPQSQRRGK